MSSSLRAPTLLAHPCPIPALHQRAATSAPAPRRATLPVHACAAAAATVAHPLPGPAFTRRRQIAADYAGRAPLVVGTLKGATIFMSDLVRAVDPPPRGLQLGFVKASSYGAGTQSSGQVALSGSGELDIAGRHVLLVRGGEECGVRGRVGAGGRRCRRQRCWPMSCTPACTLPASRTHHH